jgi:hypothetical protein
MTMGRRSVVFSLVFTPVGLQALLAGQFEQIPNPQRNPGLTGRPVPRGTEATPQPDPKEILKENQKNLRRDVDQLVQLAQDLKIEADKTNQTNVLSLTFLRKAEEIEKLARQIKSLAHAS